jgi:PPOX class probable F420-dependent enzyme
MPEGNLRQAVAMTEKEVAAFLALRLTMSLATNGAGGWPHLVAMWYGFVGGAPGFLTYRGAQKLRNIERDPRVSCLVEDGDRYDNLRGVMLRGRAEVIADEDERLSLATNITARYQGPLDQAGIETVRASIRKRVAVRIQVQDVASWDHRKLVAT